MDTYNHRNTFLKKSRGTTFKIALVIAIVLVGMAFKIPIKQTVYQFAVESPFEDCHETIDVNPIKIKQPLPKSATSTVIEKVDAFTFVDDDSEIEEELETLDEEEVDLTIIEYEEECTIIEPEIFTIVEDMPEFPGGEEAMLEYLGKVDYSWEALEYADETKVYIRFVIDEKGNVVDASVYRGISKSIDKSCLKHVKKMPKWTPGYQRGKAVKVQYIVPFSFESH